MLRYRESSGSINAVWGGARQDRFNKLSAFYINKMYGYQKNVQVELNSTTMFRKVNDCVSFFCYLLKRNDISIKIFLELFKWLLNDLCGDMKSLVIEKRNKKQQIK